MKRPKTRREELAIAVLDDALAWTDIGESPGRVRRRFHDRLIKLLRYYGKPAKRRGTA